MSELEELALYALTCHYCGARPGHWCVTARGTRLGARATWMHADRTRLLRAAWRIGWNHHREAYGRG